MKNKIRKRIRFIDYYDLIRFPNRKHIPVPIAIKEIGLKNVLKIPVSKHIKRTHDYYWCEKCQEEVEEWGDIYLGDFFKCKIHNPPSKNEYNIKIAALKELIRRKQHYKLKYIETDCITGGWIKIKDNKVIDFLPTEKIEPLLKYLKLKLNHSK